MTTITVKFVPSERSQSELQTWLETRLRVLRFKDWSVEPVFPGEVESKHRGDFVVRLPGNEESVIESLRAAPEIQSAYSAPQREPV
jgi:hypothetical protein